MMTERPCDCDDVSAGIHPRDARAWMNNARHASVVAALLRRIAEISLPRIGHSLMRFSPRSNASRCTVINVYKVGIDN